MKQILFIALPLALTACGGTTLPAPDITQESWQLKYITSELGIKHIPPNTAGYRLEFAVDGSLAGALDCNTLFGSYEIRGSELAIVQLSPTEKACPAAHQASTDAVYQSLNAATHFHADPNFLTIESADGNTLVFEKTVELCDTPLAEPAGDDNHYVITAEEAPTLVEELERTRPDFVLLEAGDCSRAFTASMNHNTLTLLRCRTDIESIE